MTKISFSSLPKITTFESFFIFDGKFYEQCDGVVMGSPLGPTFTLDNVFICHFDKQLFGKLSFPFKSIVYRRFVDDKFLLYIDTILTKDHVEKFKKYLSKHIKIKNLHRKLRKMVHCHFSI